MSKTFVPQELNDAEKAFGAPNKMPTMDWAGNDFMPGKEDIPEEFIGHHGTCWNDFVSKWFFNGLPEDVKFYPAKDIDPALAVDHVRAIMGSWAPKHEHKEAACAYLLSLWFDDIKVNGKSIKKGVKW